jgi:hypothetical protein
MKCKAIPRLGSELHGSVECDFSAGSIAGRSQRRAERVHIVAGCATSCGGEILSLRGTRETADQKIVACHLREQADVASTKAAKRRFRGARGSYVVANEFGLLAQILASY